MVSAKTIVNKMAHPLVVVVVESGAAENEEGQKAKKKHFLH
jgi:hypothetical protein